MEAFVNEQGIIVQDHETAWLFTGKTGGMDWRGPIDIQPEAKRIPQRVLHLGGKSRRTRASHDGRADASRILWRAGSISAVPSNIRDLLTRCRHAQEEMLALKRQASHMGAQGAQKEMEAYQRALETHRQDVANRLALLEDMISTLQNARSRTVMRYYYTMGWGDAQIAMEMNLTEEWVRKKRYAAIRELEKEWRNALA